MTLFSDYLLEREQLLKRLRKYKLVLFALALYALYATSQSQNKSAESLHNAPFIARITIQGEVMENAHALQKLQELRQNAAVKAVILHINSPGGSSTGGEMLYTSLHALARTKPMVSTLGTMATSAGYMIALASDYIVAYNTTTTGSIGAILIAGNAVELMKKLGVEATAISSGKFKSSLWPFETMTPEARGLLQKYVDDHYHFFQQLVAERRHLSTEKVESLSDGSIFSGRQAKALGLIDAIGDEESARAWLHTTHQIAPDLEIKDISLEKKEDWLDRLLPQLSQKFLNPLSHHLPTGAAKF